MANLLSPCGGLYFDDASFKKIGNIVTGASISSVTNSFDFCGQLYDSAVFEGRNSKDGLTRILSSINNPDAVGILPSSTVSFPCGGVKADERFFQVQNGTVSFKNGYVLTINTTPSDATISVTLDGDAVIPMNIAGTQFLMESIGDTYVWTVRKNGYTTQTGNVVASDNAIETVTLVEANILTVNVTPTDATIAVTLDSIPVTPIGETTNTFYMTETNGVYAVACSKEGYVTDNQNVTNDAGNKTITVTLTT